MEAAIAQLPVQFTIGDVERLCPSVSRDMVRAILKSLRRQKRLTIQKRGRYAIWRKLGNDPPN